MWLPGSLSYNFTELVKKTVKKTHTLHCWSKDLLPVVLFVNEMLMLQVHMCK